MIEQIMRFIVELKYIIKSYTFLAYLLITSVFGVKIIIDKLKQLPQCLKRFIRRIRLRPEKEQRKYNEVSAYVFSLIMISFLLFLNYYSLPNIFARNFPLNWLYVMLIIIAIVTVLIMMAFFNYSPKLTKPIIIIFTFTTIFSLLDKGLNGYTVAFLSLLSLLVFHKWLRDKWKKPSFWLIYTIVIMLLFLLAGINLVDMVYGYHPLSVNLNVNSNNSALPKYTVTCSSNIDMVILNQTLGCKFNPSLNILEAKITYISNTGERNTQSFAQGNITAIPDTHALFFEVKGLDNAGKAFDLSSQIDYQFFTYQEHIERREKFIIYLSALIGAILFSVPAMMWYMRDLSKPK